MLSVIIPAYNNPSDVKALLGSLRARCQGTGPFEVIVVDDGSEDRGAIAQVCAHDSNVRLLALPANRGAAAARNAGVALARYELLMFLDSDMVVLTDVVDLAVRMFHDPRIDAVVGAVSPEPINRGIFKTFWALVKAFSLPEGEYSSTFYPMISAIRKRVFDDVGGFNEGIKGASVEDYEFSLRLEARGYRVHYHPAMLVGTRYKGVLTSFRQSFSRAAKWMLLFGQRKRFDNHTTTSAQAAGTLCGASLVTSTLLWCVSGASFWLPLLFLLLYLGLNSRFFIYVSSRAGIGFVPVALGFHLLLSVVVTVGALYGALQLLLGPKHCRTLLYS